MNELGLSWLGLWIFKEVLKQHNSVTKFIGIIVEIWPRLKLQRSTNLFHKPAFGLLGRVIIFVVVLPMKPR